MNLCEAICITKFGDTFRLGQYAVTVIDTAGAAELMEAIITLMGNGMFY